MHPLRVVLLDTSAEGCNGSMSRYAKIVEETVAQQVISERPIEVFLVKLSIKIQFPPWLPSGIQVWCNHLWIWLSAKSRIVRYRPDLIHVLDGSYGYIANRLRDFPTTATVHDLIPLLQQQGRFGPDRTSPLSRVLVKATVKGLQTCQVLIADSESTKRDLVEYAGVGANEIKVVPIALDRIYTNASKKFMGREISEESQDVPMILHVGNNGHYKNREGVLRIFSRVIQRRNAKLVMVGPAPSDHLIRMVDELGLGHCMKFVQGMDDKSLRDLYLQASVFLFPSIYEGFGWPPLEAMSCGCPVICSSEASLPEVVSDAALMAPAVDESQLSSLCLKVLNDRDLAETLTSKGLKRVGRFTSLRMSKQLMESYKVSLNLGQKSGD